MSNSTPRFSHDCESCNFLGQIGRDDAYHCPTEGSIVLRDGSEGGQYASFPVDIARYASETPNGARWAMALQLMEESRG